MKQCPSTPIKPEIKARYLFVYLLKRHPNIIVANTELTMLYLLRGMEYICNIQYYCTQYQI